MALIKVSKLMQFYISVCTSSTIYNNTNDSLLN